MTRRVGVFGHGAVGRRIVAQLLAEDESLEVVVFARRPDEVPDRARLQRVRARDVELADVDLLIVASPADTQADVAASAMRRGRAVITTDDTVPGNRQLLDLDPEARALGVPVVIGSGFAPGLTDVLARHAATRFDEVVEIHVAKQGTGGPACARTHHRALKNPALDRRDDVWVRRPGGSGRELVWFPEPVDGADCYRAALPDALLLHELFPSARRITARMAATRQDRFTAWLPMLSPPHAEGGVGAVRVEIRGRADGHAVHVLGAAAPPAEGAAVVTTLLAQQLLDEPGPPGVSTLGARVEPGPFLARLRHHGVRALEFEGLKATR